MNLYGTVISFFRIFRWLKGKSKEVSLKMQILAVKCKCLLYKGKNKNKNISTEQLTVAGCVNCCIIDT